MSIYWSDIVRKIEPYVPGEQPKDKKYIKLNTNESPYPPSPKVAERIKAAATESLRLYPDPDCDELKQTIADFYNLKKDQVFVGNGSDEVLAFSFMAFFDPESTVFFPDITYSFYPVYSELFNVNYRQIPLNNNFDIDIKGFCEENNGIVIPNPNAPTGKYMDLQSIEEILQRNLKSVVVIDEAYIDFGGESAVKLINTYPNLLVVQTLSKSRALAGLRVGFALGNRGLVEALERIKNSINSYTLDRLALAGAVEAIKDRKYFENSRDKIIKTRQRVVKELADIGFKVIDSKANFVFISHASVHAKEIFLNLREKGILVRYFAKPRIDNYLRVTIGTDEEMNSLIEALKEII